LISFFLFFLFLALVICASFQALSRTPLRGALFGFFCSLAANFAIGVLSGHPSYFATLSWSVTFLQVSFVSSLVTYAGKLWYNRKWPPTPSAGNGAE